jgi:hypothetical protein
VIERYERVRDLCDRGQIPELMRIGLDIKLDQIPTMFELIAVQLDGAERTLQVFERRLP